jgi:hypothetical protein
MAEQKDVHMDELGHGKHGDKHEHGHEGHGLLETFQRPEALFTSHRIAPLCFFLVNIILLALTAQIFQKVVFVLPATVNPAAEITGQCANVSDGTACPNAAGFKCFGQQCLATTDPCYGKPCNAPRDSQCADAPGVCIDGGCQYILHPNGEYCNAPGATADNDTQILNDWTCQQGRCTSPTRTSLSNFAYIASIQAGIIGCALALEILLTHDFTPDLAALAINAGLIVIGFDGRLEDIGLEKNDGLGRTQVSFGFIAGGIAVIFGSYLLGTKKGTPSARNSIFSYILIGFWLVAFGIVSNAMSEMYEHFDEGQSDSGANVVYNWAYPATIFAASVNIALAHAVLRTGTYTQGFAAFALITGTIALAWASKHQDKGEWGDQSFSSSVHAWQSFAIIAGAFSIIIGLLMVIFHKTTKTDDQAPPNKVIGRIGALIIVIIFCTLIGIVSSLFDNSYLDKEHHGNDMRNFESNKGNPYANNVSAFAWDFSIWASAVAASFGIECLFHGAATGGITALALTEAANLVGWASKHANVGSLDPDKDNMNSTTRAWTGVALVAGVICVLVTFKGLQSSKASSQTAPAPAQQNNPDAAKSLNADDRDLFATGGGKQGDH